METDFTEYILEEFETRKKYYHDIRHELWEKREEQNYEELTILGNSKCKQDSLDYLKGSLYPLDRNKLAALLNSKYYNPQLMNTMSCLMQSITSNNEYVEEIKSWITDLHQIGAKSAYGAAYSAAIKKQPDGFGDRTRHQKYGNLFVIKTVQNPKDNLIHEAFVGMLGTNKLRQYIPNFSYVYSYFQCAPVYDDKLWCESTDNSVSYVVYENIYPSVTFKQYILDVKNTPSDIINKYLQILYSLYYAESAIGFTHNDLHTENILIRSIEKPIYIEYLDPSDKSNYLLSDGIATIIDYGFSTIKHNNKQYGTYRYVDTINPNAITDAYKVLMFILLDTINNRPDVYFAFLPLYGFFNMHGSIAYALNAEFESLRYALPPNYEYNIGEFLEYAIETYRLQIVFAENDLKNIPVLGCSDDECETKSELYRDLKLNKLNIPTSGYEFMKQIQDYSSEKDRTYIIDNFDYRTAFYNDSKLLHILEDEANIIISQLEDIEKENINNRPFSAEGLNLNQEYGNLVSKLYDIYTKHKNILDGLNTINDVYKAGFKISNDTYEQLRKTLQDIKFGLEILYETALDRESDGNEYIWYYVSLPKLLSNLDV